MALQSSSRWATLNLSLFSVVEFLVIVLEADLSFWIMQLHWQVFHGGADPEIVAQKCKNCPKNTRLWTCQVASGDQYVPHGPTPSPAYHSPSLNIPAG